MFVRRRFRRAAPIGNSHAAHTAERLGIPLLRAGFPLYDLVGGYQRTWIGYQGTRQALFDLANILLTLEKGEIRPYRSRLSQKPVAESDAWPNLLPNLLQGERLRAV